MSLNYYLLLALVVGWVSTARAESPCTEAYPLLKGEVAECDGDLVPVSVMEKLLNDQTALELAKKKLQELEDESGDKLSACETNLDTERDLRRQCEETKPVPPPREDRPISSEPWFVATVSVTATVLVFLLAQELAK